MPARKVTRRSVIAGAAAAAITARADARPLFMRAGGATPSAVPNQTFTLVEHSGVSSLGFKKGGLVFEAGDIPSGSRPVIKDSGGNTVPAQFDDVNTYPDGSLRRCCFVIRTTNFSANESRTYNVFSEAGAIDNTSSGTLADITGATDFTINFTSMTGTTTGAFPDHTASFNAHAAVPTRVTRIRSGLIVDEWEVWGMASSGGVEHGHLQTIGYASRWKNANGTTAFFRFAYIVSQHWWDNPLGGVKESLVYTATLKNSGTTIEAYRGSLNSGLVR